MTDRGRDALSLSRDALEVGPSRVEWTPDGLDIHIDEVSVPHCQRIRGTVRLRPSALTSIEVPLKPDGTHVWRPFAPTAEIEVDLNRGGWQWRGHGYFDANFGTRALEQDFSYWTWARLPRNGGTTAFYDATRRDGPPLNVALDFGADGSVREVEAPPMTRLPRSLWAVRRDIRADAGTTPRQVRPMLDAPFYTRAAVETVIGGETCRGVHEALDLDRFASPLLKPMLAVKVPRRPGWRRD